MLKSRPIWSPCKGKNNFFLSIQVVKSDSKGLGSEDQPISKVSSIDLSEDPFKESTETIKAPVVSVDIVI